MKMIDSSASYIACSLPVAEMLSARDVAGTLVAGWLKNINGAADSDVGIRKAAMKSLSRDLHAVVRQFDDTPAATQSSPSVDTPEKPASFLEDLMTLLMDALAKIVFKGLADPAEACR